MAISKPSPLVLGLIVFFLLVRPARAFGAGNIAGISKVEGQNCESQICMDLLDMAFRFEFHATSGSFIF